MKVAFAVVSLVVLGVLAVHFLLPEPRGDQISAEAIAVEIPESLAPAPLDAQDEVPFTGGEPLIADTSIDEVGTSDVQPEERSEAGDPPLEDMMRFVDGIELKASVQVFTWLVTKEERDESWAIPMEAELYDYFRKFPDLSNNFGVPYIHCRQSMCGIQIIGYGQNPEEKWATAIAEMESRSWEGAERLDTRVAVDPIRSDATGFVVYTTNISEGETP